MSDWECVMGYFPERKQPRPSAYRQRLVWIDETIDWFSARGQPQSCRVCMEAAAYSHRGGGPGVCLSRVSEASNRSRVSSRRCLSRGKRASIGTTFEAWLARN